MMGATATQVDRLFWAMATCLAVGVLWVLLTDPAFAQAMGGTGNFTCTDGRASGSLYDSGASCPVTLTPEHVFSFLVCNMEHLSSDLMGNMYCGMVTRLIPAVTGVITLAILFFGIGFTTGVVPATARDFQKFMIKMAFIIAFATQADMMIGIAYRFLVEGAREGIAISLSSLSPEGIQATGAHIYDQLDGFLGTTMRYATDYIGGKWDGFSNPCNNAIFAAIAIMAIAFPPLFFFALLIIVRVAMTFFRAVFGYVYALIGIAFLITLSPFFLSFFLFQQTKPFFDKWIGYLVSFALQMVFVFGFLTFVVSLKVSNISESMVSIVVPVQETRETTSFRLPWSYCTLCEFEVYLANDDGTPGRVLDSREYSQHVRDGKLRCKRKDEAQPYYPSSDPANKNYIPIKALNAVAPEKSDGPNKEVMSNLMKFAVAGLLSLVVLAYIVDGILAMIPQLAQRLAGGAGATYAPQLGGGTSPSVAVARMPGETLMDSFGRGFTSGYMAEGLTPIDRTARGLKRGMELMVVGAGEGAKPEQREQDPGLGGLFMRFLVNPQHGAQE